MITKIKNIYNLLEINKYIKRPKLIAWLIIAWIIWYNVATFDYMEYKRVKILNEATANAETLSWSIEEIKKDLQSKLKDLDKSLLCIKENSNTWTIVDCDTIKTKDVIIETKVGTTTLPSKNNNKWEELNNLICNKAKLNWNISPMCNNNKLLKELYNISQDRWVSFTLMLWIAYAESHIWANYAKWCSPEYNNMWWIKRKVTFDWDKIKDYPIPDKNWCRLYKFNSLQEYWRSKARSLYHWYYKKNCTTIECISQYYVRWDWVFKPAYNDRVNTFAKFDLE